MVPLITLIGYLNLFLFRHLGNTGISLILIGTLVYFWKIFYAPKIPKITVFVCLLFVSNIIWNDNNIFVLLSILGLITLIINSVVMWVYQSSDIFSFWNFVKIYLSSAVNGLNKIKLPTPVVLGSILGFGVLTMLLFLLTRGDLIFAGIIKSIFDYKNMFTISPRLIYTLFFFVLFSPFIFTLKKKVENTYLDWVDIGFRQELTIAILIVISGFGLYLLLSWSYLFIRVPLETDLIKYGVSTYSEYVRHGFVELLIAAGLTFSILWIAISANLHKYLQYLLASELVIYILTVFRRVYIYQQYHGLSVARVYGSIFLIWLVFLVISMLLKKTKYFAISVGLLTVVGLFNVERFIARYDPPTVNNRIDYVYLSSMSADGYDGWKMALDHAKVILDRDWKSMKIVDMEARREVAYTFFIISNLTANYHKYIYIYGTVDEINKYTTIIKSRNGGDYVIPVIQRMNNPFYNKIGFYIKSKNQNNLTTLDKLFSYNISQNLAYQYFQKEYGGTRVLFELQDKYYEARKKIVELGEVDFDFDISQGRLFN